MLTAGWLENIDEDIAGEEVARTRPLGGFGYRKVFVKAKRCHRLKLVAGKHRITIVVMERQVLMIVMVFSHVLRVAIMKIEEGENADIRVLPLVKLVMFH